MSEAPAYEIPTDEQLTNFVTVMVRQHYPSANKAVIEQMLEHTPGMREAWLRKHREFQARADALGGVGG